MAYPVYLSTFIGRKSELGEITALTREKSIRLLTLTGPGGSGKTRLAYEASSNLMDVFEDGLAWVDLVGLSTGENVLQALATALETSPAPGQTMLDALEVFLQPREMLIVLDNCEHLLPVCARFADALLRACPALHFLVTSRQKLGVEGEQVWPVPPLSYPAEETADPQALARYDALKLFDARARQTRPDFEIDAHNAPALAQIIRLLEGMPLAIELTAARVNLLDLPEMAQRLGDQLSFLSTGERTGDVRHQSMREAIRWSYSLLSGAERALFRRLGVFAGGFSLNAAETVCSSPPLAQAHILELVGNLLDKSLVMRERAQTGEARYRLLESIRQYAAEKLAGADEETALRDRHRTFYAQLAVEAEPHLYGREQWNWTRRLAADDDNLQAALRWALHNSGADPRSLADALGMANNLYWFWNYTERYQEGADWYAQILDAPALDRHSAAGADLLRNMATFVWLLGDYPAAGAQLQESLQIAEAADYLYGVAHAQLLLGVLALHQGQLDQSFTLLEESKRGFKRVGDPRGLGIALANLGGASLAIGDLPASRGYAEKAVHHARSHHDLWGLGLSLSGLGDVLYQEGEVERAFALMEESLEVLEQTGQNWLRAEALGRMAEMLRGQGELDRAEKHLERCFDLAQEAGAAQWQVAALESLGFIGLRRGRHRQAAGHFIEVLHRTGEGAFPHTVLHVLAGVVELGVRAGQTENAARLWGAFETLKSGQHPPPPEDSARALETIQPHLQSARAAFQSGYEYTLQEAAGLALEVAQGIEARAAGIPSEFDLRLLALGPAEVYLRGRQLAPSDWTFAKPKELLFFLASSPPKTKGQIGLVFWPDASPGQLRASLRAALYHLRRALGAREWVLYEDGFYRFNRAMNSWYDLEAFERDIAGAERLVQRAPQEAIANLESALALYRGDFLSGIASNEWAALRREELRRKYLHGMGRLGEWLTENREYSRAADVYRALIAADNLLESAHRGLMRTYAFQGERALALRQYKTLAEILLDELGARPSEATNVLYETLKEI